jgi:probable HAF family extracellular repeat protein
LLVTSTEEARVTLVTGARASQSAVTGRQNPGRGYVARSAGQVVGKSGSAGGVTHAFVYDGGMVNLNSRLPAGSGWELVEATAINDAGQIVGYGRHENHIRAFLLTSGAG